MAQPTVYDRQFNFQNQQALTPTTPLPANQVDAEYNAIKITLDEILANLALIQRDDGELANETVGVDQLKPELELFGAPLAEITAARDAAVAAAASAEEDAEAAEASATSATADAATAETAKTIAVAAKDDAITAKLAAEAARADVAANAGAAVAAAAAAALSETDAETARDEAVAAQAATEAARDEAVAAWDSFDDVYLGAKGADPTLDNDGNALVEGQLYWNTSSDALKVYDGAAWNSYSPSAGDVAGETHAASSKATPVDDDELPLVDSEASNVLKKLTWANLKATLLTYLRTLFFPLDGLTTNNTLAPHNNLIVKYVSVTQVDIDADAVVLFDSSNNAKRFASLNETLDITASGANGLDTGSEASSTWYHIWAIGKADGTLDGLLSASATSPTLPSGYTYKGYLGAVRNNGSSDFIPFLQRGNVVAAHQGGSSANPVIAGSATNFTSVDLSAYVPSTAKEAVVNAGIYTSTGANSTSLWVVPAGSTTTVTYGGSLYMGLNSTTQAQYTGITRVMMETAQTVYYRVTGTNARADIYIMGWVF